MNKAALVDEVQKILANGTSKAAAERATDAVLDALKRGLRKDREVALVGFGTFALAVRLFGNMTAGHFVILSLFGIIFLFGNLQGWNYGIGIATAALVVGIMLLELIVAFLQAYVFALLSAVFIGLMQHEH